MPKGDIESGMPFLTIITITFNAGKFLRRTLKSIDEQEFKDFEYLLIDGKSTDNTLEVAKSYGHLFDEVVSEPDNGLYDAMNKGLHLATGDLIWFINAGDEIAAPDVCQNLYDLWLESPDVIYGETIFTDLAGKHLGIRSELTPHKLPDSLNWHQMKFGMLVCHQSFIAKRQLTPFFDTDNLSADIDWEISILKSAKKIIKYDGVISKYLIGGVSNQQLKKSLLDRFKVIKKHFGLQRAIIAHAFILKRGIHKILKGGGKYW